MRAILSVVLFSGVVAAGAAPAGASVSLHRGSRGSAVRTLERRLASLHLLGGRQVNRYFGAATTRAVRRFQSAHGLPVTGSVGQADWDAIVDRAAGSSVSWTPPTSPAPRVVAHRGTGAGAPPENSMAAWRYATASADVLEFDVQWTSDHHMIVMHDSTLDRTTNCSGEVAAVSAAHIASECHLGDGSSVPTFDEVVAYAASVGRSVAPEIKPEGLTTAELTDFVAVLTAHGMDTKTFVQSFIPGYFAELASIDADLQFVYLKGGAAPTTTAVQASGAQIVGARLVATDTARVAAWHQAGLEVWLWTSQDLPGLRETWKLGADAAITDLPVDARALYGAPR